MPILFPKVDTSIQTPGLEQAAAGKNAMLKALLQGQGMAMQGDNQKEAAEAKAKADLANLLKGKEVDKQNKMDVLGEEEALGQRLRTQVQQDSANNPKMKISASKGAYSMSPINTDAQQAINQRTNLHLQEKLSSKYDKLSEFNSVLQQLEHLTNTDNKGGMLTNKDAVSRSTGKYLSAVPDKLVGLGSLFNKDLKGASEERTALGAVRDAFLQMKSGSQVTPQEADRIKGAIGWMASDDPKLVAKGVRRLALIMKGRYNTIQSGYSDAVRNAAHSFDGDPAAFYNRVYQDPAIEDQSNPGSVPQEQNTPPVPMKKTAVKPLSPAEQARLKVLEKRFGKGVSNE